MLTPYIPNKYMLKSTDNLIDLLQTNNYSGYIGSLDVESLFTNVPVDETINIIIELVYNSKNKPPKIPSNLLKELLNICTKDLVFKTPQDQIFQQINGVSMGSSLGPLFANFYMAYLEHVIFSNPSTLLITYARYADDIFIQTDYIQQIKLIKDKFEENSVLKFTIEENMEGKLPFLDIMIGKTTTNSVLQYSINPQMMGSV